LACLIAAAAFQWDADDLDPGVCEKYVHVTSINVFRSTYNREQYRAA
jgi:hypothetical protein